MYNTDNTPKPLEVTDSGKALLGKALKEYRDSQGLSLRAAAKNIADATGRPLAFSTLRDLEKGFRTPDIETLLALVQAGYGGMTLSDMFNLATDRRLALCEKPGKYIA